MVNWSNFINLFVIIKVKGVVSWIVSWTTKIKFLITSGLANLSLTQLGPLTTYCKTSNAFSRYFSAEDYSFKTSIVLALLMSLGTTIDIFSRSPN